MCEEGEDSRIACFVLLTKSLDQRFRGLSSVQVIKESCQR